MHFLPDHFPDSSLALSSRSMLEPAAKLLESTSRKKSSHIPYLKCRKTKPGGSSWLAKLSTNSLLLLSEVSPLGASQFPDTLFFSVPPWLFPCCSFISSQNALFFYSSLTWKLFSISWGLPPAPSLCEFTHLSPLPVSRLSLPGPLPRRVALSYHLTLYIHGLQHLPCDTSIILTRC